MRSESNGATPKVAVHSSRNANDMSVIPTKENASMQRVKIESDDEDEEYDNTITVSHFKIFLFESFTLLLYRYTKLFIGCMVALTSWSPLDDEGVGLRKSSHH